MTKGWFKVVVPDEDNDNTFGDYSGHGFASKDADDETERWYYAGTNGVLAEGEIKKIKGKYYGFRPEDDGENKGAAMLTDLVLLEMDPDDGSKVTKVVDDGVDGDELSDILEGKYVGAEKATLFYFGGADDGDVDGVMRTGSATINVDGDSYQFLFSKTGGAEGKGRGFTGIDSKKYVYVKGCKIKASSDDKYVVAYVNGNNVKKIDLSKVRDDAEPAGKNKDGDSVKLAGHVEGEELGKVWTENYKLVGTSGAIVKNKTAAKDGNDWYFYVDNQIIKMYTNNKTLQGTDLTGWKNWNTAGYDPITAAE